MNESPDEKYSRLQTMISDKGDTWDLSPNDKAALRHILGLVNALADDLARYTGGTCADVIRKYGELVEEIQVHGEGRP